MHMLNQMTEKKRSVRRYTADFKADAVKVAQESGKSIRSVASDIGVNVNSLHGWIRRAKADRGQAGVGVASTTEMEELRRLRKENRELRMERDFLKKTAEYFAGQKK
ncbi:MAG: transposase [Candidatus Binatia bacterium]|jgi:transposase